MMSAVVWFRKDLRLDDNPAWAAATRDHDLVQPVFVVDDALWGPAAKRRTDLLASHLVGLDRSLARLGGRLRVERGDPSSILAAMCGPSDTLYFNRDYTPHAVDRDSRVMEAVGTCSVHDGTVVHPPGSISTATGSPYRVFTPYWRQWSQLPVPPVTTPGSADIADAVGTGIPEHQPVNGAGEEGAAARLDRFRHLVGDYERVRDLPADDATSRLSADLKFGTVGPRRIISEFGGGSEGARAFVRQLAWRDFYTQVLVDRPDTVDAPYRSEYASIAWDNDPDHLAAWKVGRTGYPIVDAGMRQLSAEGFIHNRVRMIAASFLVKDLLIDWRIGERFFRHHLIDGDVAQNVGNWQWVAGTGVDAAPYFRIFNPTTQSRKFDPEGRYIRRWVPELADVEAPAIHAPWEAAAADPDLASALAAAGYPTPIVDHAQQRERTLLAYREARGASDAAPEG